MASTSNDGLPDWIDNVGPQGDPQMESLRAKLPEPVKGKPRIEFGSNLVYLGRPVVIVVMNGRPIVWATDRDGRAMLNADIMDADDEMVVQIRDNVVTVNRDNAYETRTYPEGQFPPDRVVVVNKYAEFSLDLQLGDDGTWRIYGDFYCQKAHIVATPQHVTIQPRASTTAS
jgi:hypothetical protein